MTSWRADPVFGHLCDLVATDHLIVLSGAGISSSLSQKGHPGKRLPTWPQLLNGLLAAFGDRLRNDDRDDCRRLIAAAAPSGPSLILAASLLRSAAPEEFDRRLRIAVTEEPGSTTATHEKLEALQPRGIVTFNYDCAHESAFLPTPSCAAPAVLTPWDEAALRRALADGLKQRFVLKAHGSLTDTEGLVLTQESYRRLIVRSPAYRSFVQNILTNFSLLIVGFRFSDPDFDLFIDSMAHRFGSPLHDHVGIMHRSENETDREILLRRRYGIRLLLIDSFDDIPKILDEASKTAGPKLEQTIANCLDPSFDRRSAGHDQFRRLGPAGRAVASRVLTGMLQKIDDSNEHFRRAEIAYSLGVLDPVANKETLLRLVDEGRSPDVVGRALTVLRPALEPTDLATLEAWRARFREHPLEPDPLGRIPVYLDYLLVYVRQRFEGSNELLDPVASR